MNFITSVSLALNYAVNQAIFVVNFLLRMNHDFVSGLLYTFTFLIDHVIKTCHAVQHIANCYAQDFIVFLDEFGGAIILVIKFLSHVTINIFASLSNQLSVIYSFFYGACCSIRDTMINFIDILLYALQCVRYFFYLTGSAFLLLLQCIPNGFILLYEFLVLLCVSVYNSVCYSFISVCHFIYNVRSLLQESIQSIPPKAYIGLVMLTLIYYKRGVISRYLQNLFSASSVIMIRMHGVITDYIKHFLVICAVKLVCVFIVAFDFMCVLGRSPAILVSYFRTHRRAISHTVPSSSAESSTASLRFRYNKAKISLCSKFKHKLFNNEEDSDDEDSQSLQAELIREKDRHLCVVCQDRERNVILLPCKHLCLCQECYRTLRRQYSWCPMCRQHIRDTISVFM